MRGVDADRRLDAARLGPAGLGSALALILTSLLGAIALRPGAAWWLALAVFAPVFMLVPTRTPRHALLVGWCAGALITASGFRFAPEAAAAVAGWSSAATWAAYALFVAYRGAWIGVALAAGSFVARRGGRGSLAAVVVLVVLERLCPDPLPFAYGSTLAEAASLVQIADVLGPSGPTLTLGLASVLLAEVAPRAWAALRGAASAGAVARGTDRLAIALSAAWLGCAALYGHARLATIDETIAAAPSLRTELIPLARGAPAVGALSKASANVDLIVLGEGAIPAPVPEHDLAPLVAALAADPGRAPVLVGATARDFESPARGAAGAATARDRNVALLLADGGIVGRYEKHRLLPVAEQADGLFASAGLAAPGAVYAEGKDRPTMRIGDVPIAVTICYEAALPDYVRTTVEQTRGQLIVNLASDSWFVGSDEPALHVLAARMRAIETRRSLVRATHDGISAAIDPAGRVLASSAAGERGSIVVDVPLLTERTIYARFGALPLTLVLALLFVASLRTRRD